MRNIVQKLSLGDTSEGDILSWHLGHRLRHEQMGAEKKARVSMVLNESIC
jgi:hypothetical protein